MLKKLPLLVLLLWSISFELRAQQRVPNRFLADAGMGFHGSGDLMGGYASVGLQQGLGKHFSINYKGSFTTHGGSAYGFSINQDDPYNRSEPLYWVTTGVQAEALAAYHPFGRQHSWLTVMAGPLLRYQLSSYPNSYQYFSDLTAYSPLLDRPFYSIMETQPKVWTLGYHVVLESMLLHRPNWSAGIQLRFQNDTNGDALSSFGLSWQHNLYGPKGAKQ